MENRNISFKIGEKILFGSYVWRVLDVQDSKALILSEYILGEKQYHDDHGFVTWETSVLRKFLNENFFDIFDLKDKYRIADTVVKNSSNIRFGTNGGIDTVDKIFILSIDEVIRYFGDSKQVKNEELDNRNLLDDQYNKERLAQDNLGVNTDWWLRSSGGCGTDTAYVDFKGRINLYGIDSIPENYHDERNIRMGVRPALWIKIDLNVSQTEDIAELLSCVRDGEIDSKFAYLGKDASDKYMAIMRSPEYTLIQKSKRLIEDNIDKVINSVLLSDKRIRLFSLGVGDGDKEICIIKKLINTLDYQLECTFVDISSEFLNVCNNAIMAQMSEEEMKKIKIKLLCSDFFELDKCINASSSNHHSLFLLLGNTLGNFHEDKLLSKIVALMNVGDYFLFDNQTISGFVNGKLPAKESESLLGMYGTEDEKNYAYSILAPTTLSQADGELKQRLCYKFKDWEESYSSRNDCLAVLQEFIVRHPIDREVCGHHLKLESGHDILVYKSKKYTKEAISNLVLRYMNVEKVFSSDKQDYVLILCRNMKTDRI